MHTVNEMLDLYERERGPYLVESTRTEYKRHIRTLRENFGAKDVRAVTRQEVRDFLAVSKGKVLRIRVVSVLRAAYSEAIRWDWLDGNPCTLMERSEPKVRNPALTIEEFQAALKLASTTRAGRQIALVMELALHTGRNQGDIISLRWTQVDRQSGTILFRSPHTKKKVPVLLTPLILEILERAKRTCGGKEYVVTKRTGDRYTSEGFRAVWQRFLNKQWRKTGNDRFLFHDIAQLHRTTFGAKDRTLPADPVDAYPQFSASLKSQAAANAPYYKVLFCLEQLIRERIVATLEGAAGTDWWESDRIQQSMRQEVSSLVTREVDSAITQRSKRMIDYTTLGQLGQIIRDNWDLFDGQFVSKGAVSAVLARLNLARGPIAHCCPVSALEVERLGLAVRDWFNIEKQLSG